MKDKGNGKSDIHTDWRSASSWFNESQNDRINTSGGKYSEEKRRREAEMLQRERNRRNEISERERADGLNNRKAVSEPAAKKISGYSEMKTLPTRRVKNINSVKSNDELRREHAEKTRRKRKRRIIKSFVFTALIFVAVFIVASLTFLFRIESINIESDTRYSEEEILEASGIEIGDNLWRTLTSDVYEKLSYSLPYIGVVKLKRNIPSEITVIVSESVPEYAIRNGKRYIIVDGNDKVLELKAAKSGGVPVIEGLDAAQSEEGRVLKSTAPENCETAKEILAAAEKNSVRISRINVGDTNNISAVCAENLRLDIGSASQLDEKLKMANEVISKLKSEGTLAEGIINLKSAAKAFYREGDIDENESGVKKKNKAAGSDSSEEQTSEAENTQSATEPSENTTVSENAAKSGSDVPSPPSQRPE